jgi:hypothetical protein
MPIITITPLRTEAGMIAAPTSKASERPLYRLTLRPERGVDAERALRRLLKIALRTLGLRCVSIEEVQP